MLTMEALQAQLPVDGWGRVLEYHHSLPSTNDLARRLAQDGAPHGTLVVANEQTAGKGRGGNHWYTPPDAALAMSLVVRPQDSAKEFIGALSVLGALAVVQSLQAMEIAGQIKWPNDVLVEKQKVCGVLSEASWQADRLDFAIVGIGVNVRPASVPSQDSVQWPAACLDAFRDQPVSRLELLVDIVRHVAEWYRRIGHPDLTAIWEQHLAYKNQPVRLRNDDQVVEGRLKGLDLYGRLIIHTRDGDRHLSSGAWQFSRVDRPEN